MSARAAAYQTQITGQTGQAYVVNGVKFDGFTDGVLLDAKGPGYATFVDSSGQFKPWFTGQQSLLNQADSQLTAAAGTPITWHVAEPSAATTIQNLLQSNGYGAIKVVNTLPK
jgi:filamentous hemagglutinin